MVDVVSSAIRSVLPTSSPSALSISTSWESGAGLSKLTVTDPELVLSSF